MPFLTKNNIFGFVIFGEFSFFFNLSLDIENSN